MATINRREKLTHATRPKHGGTRRYSDDLGGDEGTHLRPCIADGLGKGGADKLPERTHFECMLLVYGM